MTFLQSMRTHSQTVLQYENKALQKKALELIPVDDLEAFAIRKMRMIQSGIKQQKINEFELPDIKELFLAELLSWFKNSFFSWVDTPPCNFCGCVTKFSSFSKLTDVQYASKVEVYECSQCHRKTEFVRYNDASKLLETRKGRCGEWANCFTLLCRALGWDARYVVDVTDHVWTEVYSITQERWIHCDPCENTFDTPLIYEEGWGKNLSYVLAYSYDDVQDVTWRYSRHHKNVLSRRHLCSEKELLEEILKLRYERQKGLSKTRQTYITKRLLMELVELMTPQHLGNNIYEGRTSGSLAWRTARGEVGNTIPSRSYVWYPTPEEQKRQTMHILYSCARDCYIRPTAGGEILNHWEEGVYKTDSVFRKEEKDWKAVYLARTQGSTQASLSWKVDCETSGLVIDWLEIHCTTKEFENGKVHLQVCTDNICLPFPPGSSVFETKELSGCRSFVLSANFSGGKGNVAWQHAQLLRQPLNDMTAFPLSIKVKFAKLKS